MVSNVKYSPGTTVFIPGNVRVQPVTYGSPEDIVEKTCMVTSNGLSYGYALVEDWRGLPTNVKLDLIVVAWDKKLYRVLFDDSQIDLRLTDKQRKPDFEIGDTVHVLQGKYPIVTVKDVASNGCYYAFNDSARYTVGSDIFYDDNLRMPAVMVYGPNNFAGLFKVGLGTDDDVNVVVLADQDKAKEEPHRLMKGGRGDIVIATDLYTVELNSEKSTYYVVMKPSRGVPFYLNYSPHTLFEAASFPDAHTAEAMAWTYIKNHPEDFG